MQFITKYKNAKLNTGRSDNISVFIVTERQCVTSSYSTCDFITSYTTLGPSMIQHLRDEKRGSLGTRELKWFFGHT